MPTAFESLDEHANQELPGWRMPEGMITKFAVNFAIFDQNEERIGEYRFRHLKADTVLDNVSPRLFGIPSEVDLHSP